MKFEIGDSFRLREEGDDDHYLDISIYQNKWMTKIVMNFWQIGNSKAIKTSIKSHFNFNRIMPMKFAIIISNFFINRQSKIVWGKKIIKLNN